MTLTNDFINIELDKSAKQNLNTNTTYYWKNYISLNKIIRNRREGKIFNTKMLESSASVYRLYFDDDFITSFKKLKFEGQTNVKNILKLKRYDYSNKNKNNTTNILTKTNDTGYNAILNGSSYTDSLKIYLDSIKKLGQTNIYRSISGLLHIIKRKYIGFAKKNEEHLQFIDDFIRVHLKMVSEYAFKNMFSKNIGFIFLMNMQNLGGKAPYKKSDIIDDITNWVSKSDSMDGNINFIRSELNLIVDAWPRLLDQKLFLSFREYCNDVYRWGTSGGSPKSLINGEEYRTKWAWGLSRLTNNGSARIINEKIDIYNESLKEKQYCQVALKEEPSKTRAVITTPMSSYLRQSYLLYRWGKPNLRSPISNPNLLSEFQRNGYKWYGCIDGSKFDHDIPAWFVTLVIDILGNLDSETRYVANEELKHLSNLEVKWGKEVWRWKGGLLSGWRITSIIGTIMSEICARYIIKNNNLSGMDYLVMGDDLILYSNTQSLTTDEMVDLYNSFGLHSNPRKTTSGKIGEYLRKIYSPMGVLGYPASGLRALMFANPWVNNYTYEHEVEVCTNWLMYYSRLIQFRVTNEIHNFIFNNMIKNLQQLFKYGSKHDWSNYLRTPISAGGGGCLEWSDTSCWVNLKRKKLNNSKKESFFAAIGIEKSKMMYFKTAEFKSFNVANMLLQINNFKSKLPTSTRLYIPKNVNITKILYNWYNDDRLNISFLQNGLKIMIPIGLRINSKAEILNYIMGMNGNGLGGLTSVQTTLELSSHYTGLVKFISDVYLKSRKHSNKTSVKALATLYSMTINANVVCTLGTM